MTQTKSCSVTPAADTIGDFLNSSFDFLDTFQDENGSREETSDPSTWSIDNGDLQIAQEMSTLWPNLGGEHVLHGLSMGSSLDADMFIGSGKPDANCPELGGSVLSLC